ncbi:MAG TPA: CcoQ/FixQ family Cbb3-type cytochrome c oxidase assembly chaperone [Flavobacteriales bacterium]|jgi:cytochrome c oxidase cbb3-type subunit 4
MKFINYLESITGIGIYPLCALIIFFTVFIMAAFMVTRTDKKTIEEQKNIPFD